LKSVNLNVKRIERAIDLQRLKEYRPYRSCNIRVGLSSLAARARASSVQVFRTNVQSLARTRATIPWSAQPRCRPA